VFVSGTTKRVPGEAAVRAQVRLQHPDPLRHHRTGNLAVHYLQKIPVKEPIMQI
jgi:hypothetical protein